MTFTVITNLVSMLLDLLGLYGRSEREKNLEILGLSASNSVSFNGHESAHLASPGGRNCHWFFSSLNSSKVPKTRALG
jgi:hypothetical protein